MSLKSPPPSPTQGTFTTPQNNTITSFPRELHLNILTYLRATDLSALQRTARCFNNRDLIVDVVDHYANVVYPSDLTEGFDTPIVSGEVKSAAVVQTASYFAANKKVGGNKKNKKNVHQQHQQQLASSPSSSVTPTKKVLTYEMLRNMEMLVVARVLSRPEPPIHERDSCFFVSRSWCKAALRWLEVQEEEMKEKEERRRHAALAEEAKLAAAALAAQHTPSKKGGKHTHNRKSPHPGSSGKKKLSRKEQKQRDRRMSDSLPPWSNINTDIVCEHGSVKQCSSKSARARRRVMDRHSWKVLKKLYPESVQLEASGNSIQGGGCLICAAEQETAKKAETDKKEEEKANRKKCLEHGLVRGFYTRGSKGYPLNSISSSGGTSLSAFPCTNCPLKPGVYCALPRSWCHRWRKYIKTGDGGFPSAPDASEVLCDAHNLPLVPPHLESFLRGESSTLLSGNSQAASYEAVASTSSPPTAASRIGSISQPNADAEMIQALRAAGLSESELYAQRVAMRGLEDNMRHANIHGIHDLNDRTGSESTAGLQHDRTITNEQLDRENRVVVEILTDDEVTALEKSWPRCQTYALRFAVVDSSSHGGGAEVVWSTSPCRECDPSSRSTENLVVRNRFQKRGFQ